MPFHLDGIFQDYDADDIFGTESLSLSDNFKAIDEDLCDISLNQDTYVPDAQSYCIDTLNDNISPFEYLSKDSITPKPEFGNAIARDVLYLSECSQNNAGNYWNTDPAIYRRSIRLGAVGELDSGQFVESKTYPQVSLCKSPQVIKAPATRIPRARRARDDTVYSPQIPETASNKPLLPKFPMLQIIHSHYEPPRSRVVFNQFWSGCCIDLQRQYVSDEPLAPFEIVFKAIMLPHDNSNDNSILPEESVTNELSLAQTKRTERRIIRQRRRQDNPGNTELAKKQYRIRHKAFR